MPGLKRPQHNAKPVRGNLAQTEHKQTPQQRRARTRATDKKADAVVDQADTTPPPPGTKWDKQWNAGPKACDECAALDGERVDADGGYFSDGTGLPSHHPNCECTIDLISVPITPGGDDG